MSKYIDADRLKAKLDEHYRKYQSKYMETRTSYTQGLIDALDLAEQVIDSLQKEQPSLPDNLDEAAEEYAYNNWEDNDYHTGASEGLPFDAIGHTEKCFKAGAEWMAEQKEDEK